MATAITPAATTTTADETLLWADTYIEWNDLAGATPDLGQSDFFYEMADIAKDLTLAFASGHPEELYR